jgi:hypothetical protein
MTAEIIDLAAHRELPSPGNGAREVMCETMAILFGPNPNMGIAVDDLLAHMWLRGFKIVPVEDDHE